MIIYKTTNLLNNKIYIGLDTHNNPKYLGSGTIITNAIRKYGKDNFIKDILEVCNDLDTLKIREKYWIEYYNSTNKNIGYNIMTGSSIPWNTKLEYTTEMKEKISKGHQGQIPWNKGKKNIYSEDTKRKMSDAKKGIPRPELADKLRDYYQKNIHIHAQPILDTRTDKIYTRINDLRKEYNLTEYMYKKMLNAGIFIKLNKNDK
jgi:group I intron endonuclease